MGTQNERFRAVRNLNQLEQERSFKQEMIDSKKNAEDRRRLGQYSTPFELAREIVSYGLSLLDTDKIRFLEPCIGSGSFYSALLNMSGQDYTIQALGIEIDAEYCESAKKLWGETGINIINGDFTREEPNEKFNLLLTNPPYVRHHYLSPKEKTHLIEKERDSVNITLSRLSGLYCHFILLADKWLSADAICGWLIPSEFMDVNYGSAIKDYLLNQVHLLKIHRYDPGNSMFSDALVSSCVVWYKKEIVDFDYDVEFSFGGTHDMPLQKRMVKKSALISERKWTRFPNREIREEERKTTTLGDFFEIKRGVVTGDNNFFIMTMDKISKLGLDMSFFKPILPSPRYLKTDFVDSDKDGLPLIEPNYFLLDCELAEHEIEENYPATWNYLQSGVEKTSKKYLCKNRKKWYWQEQRESTYFLCSYMGRGHENSSPIRFILNLSEAIVTNSYLMLYPKHQLQQIIFENPDSVFEIWKMLRKINASAIEAEGRIYGGGLKKIEPRELARVSCENIFDLVT